MVTLPQDILVHNHCNNTNRLLPHEFVTLTIQGHHETTQAKYTAASTNSNAMSKSTPIKLPITSYKINIP